MRDPKIRIQHRREAKGNPRIMMKEDPRTRAESRHKEQPVHAGGDGYYLGQEIYTSSG